METKQSKFRKKKCGPCKAFESGKCSLGYLFKPIYFGRMIVVTNGEPLENCPKPLTTKKFVELLNKQQP